MKSKFFVHEKAIVDPGSEIGANSRVWAFAHVMSGAVVGTECNIGEHCFVESGAKLGNQVTVKNGVHIWEGVTAEDGVFFGPACALTNHSSPRAFIKNPKETWLKRTLFRKGCTIGANATVICGIEIGEYAFIAAGSVVTRSVPAFTLVRGNPARFAYWVCKCTQKLAFINAKATCPACKSQFEEDESGRIRLLE